MQTEYSCLPGVLFLLEIEWEFVIFRKNNMYLAIQLERYANRAPSLKAKVILLWL